MPQPQDDQLPVTPGVVTWARSRAGFSLQDAANYFSNIAAWERGEARPTYGQLEQMADKFKVPAAVFFFPQPPEIEPLRTSFRTLTDEDFEAIPRPLRSLLRKGQAMQLNLSELHDGNSPSQRRITDDLQFPTDVSPGAMAGTVREYIGVSVEEQMKWSSVEEAIEHWRDAFANVGVFVFKDAFHIENYFGFCLYDDAFPIVYVNNSSPKTRQIFTLFHELAHLLFHTSGVDVRDDKFFNYASQTSRDIEVVCNAFTGAFLVPDRAFTVASRGLAANRETASQLAGRFHVSREVIYRKFLDRGLISRVEYQEAAQVWAKQAGAGSQGGNYYYNQFSYLGKRYIDLALSRYYQQRFDDVQLAQYLNIKPRSVPAFEVLYGRR